MMNRWVYCLLPCILLSGCAQYLYNILPAPWENRYPDIQAYIQSQRVYNQFHSVASCVVLWCAPEVVTLHDQLYRERTGFEFSGSHPDAFILMMPYDTHAVVQTDYRHGTWGVTLEHDGTRVPPWSVYRASLDVEYQYMLGPYYNHFYNVYAVIFKEHPNPPFTISLQSPGYMIRFVWNACD